MGYLCINEACLLVFHAGWIPVCICVSKVATVSTELGVRCGQKFVHVMKRSCVTFISCSIRTDEHTSHPPDMLF